MSIKGYPTSQKNVKGLADGSSGNPDFVTVQPSDLGLRRAIDVPRFAFRVGHPTAPRTAQVGTGNPTDGGPTQIADTSTPARVGDFVRFNNGLAQHLEIAIIAVTTNAFQLAARIPDAFAPVSGDEFFIMRYATQLVGDDGTQLVTVSPAPISFVLDGIDEQVERDTATPANSKPLPIINLDDAGLPVNFEGLRTPFDLIRHDYGATPVDDNNYEELITSTSQDTKSLTLFDAGGYAMVLALGAASSEVDFLYIPPGGFSGPLPIEIPSGTRLSIKCLETGVTVGAGQLIMNLMGA